MRGIGAIPLGFLFGTVFVFPPSRTGKSAHPGLTPQSLALRYDGAASGTPLPAWTVADGLSDVPKVNADSSRGGAAKVATEPDRAKDANSGAWQEAAETIPETLHESEIQAQNDLSPTLVNSNHSKPVTSKKDQPSQAQSDLRTAQMKSIQSKPSAGEENQSPQRTAVRRRRSLHQATQRTRHWISIETAVLVSLVSLLILVSYRPAPAALWKQKAAIEDMAAKRMGNSFVTTALQDRLAARVVMFVSVAAAIMVADALMNAVAQWHRS
ncbi:UNVERIFIED_CONTAM: hypothetical protein HHA_208980 [Hammondia hammondi]|eukprot:XP_008887041.1 hypothetical protein HHA_208980 [Hammondia hammondi]